MASVVFGLPSTGVSIVWNETPAGTIDGINKVFTLGQAPASSSRLHLFRNGILYREGASNDFVLSGNTITFTTAPAVGSVLLATYQI